MSAPVGEEYFCVPKSIHAATIGNMPTNLAKFANYIVNIIDCVANVRRVLICWRDRRYNIVVAECRKAPLEVLNHPFPIGRRHFIIA